MYPCASRVVVELDEIHPQVAVCGRTHVGVQLDGLEDRSRTWRSKGLRLSWYLAKILEDDLDDPGFGAEARLAGYDRPCSRCGPRERAEEAHAGTWRARRVIGGRGRGCRAGSARGPGERVERRGRGVGEAPVAGWPGPARGDAGDGEARRRKTARGYVRRGPRRGDDGQTRRRAKRRLGARRAAGARGAPLLDAR